VSAPVVDPTPTDVEHRIAVTRAELESTLNAIEDKLNVPKKIRHAARRARKSYDRNPLPWIAGAAVAAVAAASAIAWAALSKD
jgi:hypothetical protein